MKQLSISGIKTATKEVAIRLNKPIIVRGGAGVGKSQAVEQVVEELDSPKALKALLGPDCTYTGCMICDIRLSTYDTVDLRGYPGVDKKTATAIWYPMSTLPFIGYDTFPDDKLIIILFDEAPDADAKVLGIAQQITLDRCIGEHMLKPNARIVMAGNRESDQGLAKKFPFPLNNRLIHYEAINPLDEFCVYAQSQGVPPVFIAYWNFRKEMLNTYDPKKVQAIVATNRTWFAAVDIWTDKRLDSYPEIKEASMIGAIGEGPAVDFFAYNEVWQSLPHNVTEILKAPDTYPMPEELSIRYAMAMMVSEKMTLANVDKLHVYIKRFPAEIVVMAWTLATARDATLTDADAYLDYCKRFKEVYASN